MNIAIGADHGGVELKAVLVKKLKSLKHTVSDKGAFSTDSCDYPVIGAAVARALSSGKVSRGVLLCRSGAGMAIVANKFPKVRAVVCQSVETARLCRQHNDANLLVLSADVTSPAAATAILKTWLETPFEGGRHARRVRQIRDIEKEILHV